MLSWFHISGNLSATCHALTVSKRQRTTPPGSREQKALAMGAFDTASALREDTTPEEKVSFEPMNEWFDIFQQLFFPLKSLSSLR